MKSKKIIEKPAFFKEATPDNKEEAFVRKGEEEPCFYLRDTKGIYNYSADFGRANGIMDCPWCFSSNKVYVWSLAGGGKRCEGCRAMLSSRRAIVSVEAYKKFQELQVERAAKEAVEKYPVTLQKLGE